MFEFKATGVPAERTPVDDLFQTTTLGIVAGPLGRPVGEHAPHPTTPLDADRMHPAGGVLNRQSAVIPPLIAYLKAAEERRPN